MFSLTEATSEDAGDYVCQAENIAGTVSKTTTITVQQPPALTVTPDHQLIELTEGDELNLGCFGSGDPRPSVSWQRPGAAEQDYRFSQGSGDLSAKVQIFRVSHSDAGTYTCVGVSTAGRDERYVQVIVKPKRGDVGKWGLFRDV